MGQTHLSRPVPTCPIIICYTNPQKGDDLTVVSVYNLLVEKTWCATINP